MNTVKIKLKKRGQTLDQFVDSMEYNELLRGLPLIFGTSDDLEIVAEVEEKGKYFVVRAWA